MIDWRRVTAMSRFCYDRLKEKWQTEQSERKKRSDMKYNPELLKADITDELKQLERLFQPLKSC
jgi:hypothetical protein